MVWGAPALPGAVRRRSVLGAAFVGALLGAFMAAGLQHGLWQRSVAPVATTVHGRPLVALWVRLETLTDPRGTTAALDMARRLGAGMVYAQVLARGEAAYRSSIWPMASQVASGYDPLGDLVQRAHRQGVAVYAWIGTYAWGRLGQMPADATHPLGRHPDWVSVDRSGRSLWRFTAGQHPEVNALFVDPGLEGVRRTLVETVLELARRYDIAGVQLDYVRYPGHDIGYHPESLRRFWYGWYRRTGSSPPSPSGPVPVSLPRSPEELAAWDAYRRAQVTDLVREIARRLTDERLEVTLSAAVMPDPARAARDYLQEWGVWLHEGLIGSVALMTYSPSPEAVARWVEAARRVTAGVPAATDAEIRAGIGTYLLTGRPDVLTAQMRAAMDAGASGLALFSFESLEGAPDLVGAAAAYARGWATAATGGGEASAARRR